METADRIFIAGSRGLVGSALVRLLRERGFTQLLTPARRELDLTDAAAVERFFATARPEYVFLAAARVGGIWANSSYPANFIQENLAIQSHVIDAAWRYGVRKLQFLGSSCIYPRHAPQPIREEHLLTGPLEPTNEAYAIAKIAGIKMCQAYRAQYSFDAISLMPTNLYGPGDNFDPNTSHVVPALLGKFHEAVKAGKEEVTIWGSGQPRREFLHVDDLASAALFLMDHYSAPEILNVGTGEDVSIAELAGIIKRTTGFQGRLSFDSSKPDGMPRKLLDVSRLHALGWHHHKPLEKGIEETYQWYGRNAADAAQRS